MYRLLLNYEKTLDTPTILESIVCIKYTIAVYVCECALVHSIWEGALTFVLVMRSIISLRSIYNLKKR